MKNATPIPHDMWALEPEVLGLLAHPGAQKLFERCVIDVVLRHDEDELAKGTLPELLAETLRHVMAGRTAKVVRITQREDSLKLLWEGRGYEDRPLNCQPAGDAIGTVIEVFEGVLADLALPAELRVTRGESDTRLEIHPEPAALAAARKAAAQTGYPLVEEVR